MQSEFYNVALDRIRYSLVWEDSKTLYNALSINSHDKVLIITSGGCNVLNALLKNPAAVTAIDLNPVQNKLLLLKKHIILHHDFNCFQSLLGFLGREAVSKAKEQLFKTLSPGAKNFWSCFFNNHPEGLLTSGKLENYINGFYHTLNSNEQQHLHQLITFKDVKKQYEFFIEHLHDSSFRQKFIEYFDDKNLSKGRDPNLFRYAIETGGQAFYNRLVHQVQSSLVANNFYFQFFFFGPQNLSENILPPSYCKENYHVLKQQLSKLQVITGEAIDYLLSAPGGAITKASLSNIFEYASRHEFENACNALSKIPNATLQIVFWNLLNDQGKNFNTRLSNQEVKKVNQSDESCFYFKEVLLLKYAPVTSLTSNT